MKTLSEYIYKGPAFTLNDGREINIQHLGQSLTYAHVLEGIPYGPYYEGTVSLHLDWAKKQFPGRKIIVLKPRLRPLAIDNDNLNNLQELWQRAKDINADGKRVSELTSEEWAFSRYPEPVCIGTVCCRALFESTPIDENAGMLSELFVVWFQDDFALPVDPYVVEQIKAIDWNNQAEDTEL